jgi:hypothetical protein
MGELTLGQKRVGFNFNPSEDSTVKMYKTNFSEIIDTLEQSRLDKDGNSLSSEKQRTISRAQTSAEDACMLAVKSIFQ